MSKLNLNKIEKIGIWIWRILTTVVVCGILSYQLSFHQEVRGNYQHIKPLIEDTSKAVSESNSQSEIPDENNEEFEVSCVTDSNIEYVITHPAEVKIFLEELDSLIGSKPHLMNLLIALLTSDRDDIRSYLQEEYSAGFPNK